MKAIEIMNEEHKYILRMLKVVRKACLNIMNQEEIIYEDFDKIIDFIRNYSDKHHHKKEEDILFTKMVEHIGETAEKVVNQGMLVEHDLGRLYIRQLVEALEKVKGGDKEDRVIYKFAERELSREVLYSINMECENFEFRNEDIRNKYVLILEELENRY